MQDDVFRAILAMYSYNHGETRSISFRREWTNLGKAAVQTDSSKPIPNFGEAQNAIAAQINFGATAYKWTDSAGVRHDVISYRGTDVASTGLPYFNDVWNGWSVGAGDVGFVGPSQATLARQFYNAVLHPDLNVIVDTANVELVGHSLGGGLAGFRARYLAKR